MSLRPIFIPAIFIASAAQAEVPRVVTDIAAVQSLAAQVMGDLGAPRALMERGASPHGYALRPSDAKALQAADVVFWTGPVLAPWLADVIGTVAPDAQSVMLSEADGTTVLPFREGATFERHSHDHHAHDEDAHENHDDHAHDEHAHDEDAHEDHDDHAHDEHAHDEDAHEDHDDHAHDEHAHDEDAHEDHDDHAHDEHGAYDPHMWLDPMNGRVWLAAIAEELAAQDPENAATYRANAAAAQAQMDTLMKEVAEDLAPIKDLRFVVFHDAYQYYETRFDMAAAGSISLSDASAPSPARVREVQNLITDQAVTCVFSEPQFNAGLVDTVLDGTAAKTAVIDPLGAAIEPGPDYYPALIESITAAFVSCR